MAKVAIITGASSGIGRSIAEAMAHSKYRLVICGRNEVELQITAQLCRSKDPNTNNDVTAVVGDVTSDEVCKRIVDAAVDTYGRVDVLVNNAGILNTVSVPGLQLQDYDSVMDTNVRSVVNLTMKALDYLIQSKGCIVNISSVCGLRPMPNRVFYCMSKAALDMFTKTMARELGPHNVRVNSVNPGVVPTNIHKRLPNSTAESVSDFYKSITSRIPCNRVGTVEEISNVVLFLASEKASYVTGQTWAVDGGIAL